jgi:amino acid permease
MAWKQQGHSLEELPFQALFGVWGSYFGMVLISAVLVAQFYIVSLFSAIKDSPLNKPSFLDRHSGRSVECQMTP